MVYSFLLGVYPFISYLAGGLLASLTSVCHDLSENSACYGADRASALFTADLAPIAFSQPGDQLTLDLLQRITTSGYDGATWGIVGMKLSNADAIMTGDASIENSGQTGAFTIGTGFRPSACTDTPSLVAFQSPADQSIELEINTVTMRLNGALVVFQQQSANSLAVIVQRGQLEIVGTGTAQAGQTALGVIDNTGRVLFWSAPRPINGSEMQVTQIADDAIRQWQTAADTAAESMVEVPAETLPVMAEEQPVLSASADAISVDTTCTHTVARGETLYRIATRYGTTVRALGDSNRITNVNLLSIGQQLTVPCSGDTPAEVPLVLSTQSPLVNTGGCGEHIVSSGDNLYRISLRYGTSVQAIAAANSLSNPRLIYAGQRLVIPCE